MGMKWFVVYVFVVYIFFNQTTLNMASTLLFLFLVSHYMFAYYCP